METSLTPKQRIILATVRDLKAKLGKSPTLREIKVALGYAGISSVQRHVDALKKKGYLQNEPYQSRSLEVSMPDKTVNIPLVGNVAAGTPILAQENVEAYIPYDGSKIGDPRGYFFLRAVGDSMNSADVNGKNIDDGDFVLIKNQPTAEQNQKVLALIGDDATIKKFKYENGMAVLYPESTNSANKPIYVFKDLLIQGVVYDVIKKEGENRG